jgi:hypothetical protein
MKQAQNTKYDFKPVEENDIAYVLQHGIKAQVKMDKVTEILKRDVFNQTKNHQTELTKRFDLILGDDQTPAKNKQDLKNFIRKQVQTLIKEKATQEILLNEETSEKKVTIKKVTSAMILNEVSEKYPTGQYENTFTEKDLGSYRVIVENKPAPKEFDLLEALVKFCKANEVEAVSDEEKLDIYSLCHDVQVLLDMGETA